MAHVDAPRARRADGDGRGAGGGGTGGGTGGGRGDNVRGGTPVGLSRELLGLALLAGVAGAAYLLFPYNLAFTTRVVIMMLFVLSLDFVLGVAGISTLGHAALYGTGAYAAGLFAIHVSNDPLAGLVAGGLAGAVVALASGLFLLRSHGLTLLMLSIAVTEVLRELANKYAGLTGGADGLGGIEMGRLLGLFEFDFIGRVGYVYAVVVLIASFAILRRITNSSFGLAARGIRESAPRMRAIGTPVYRHLIAVYVIGGVFAGIAGALEAQSTALVSLNVYGFQLSAEALIMLILGGTGRLWGAILGTAVFMGVHEVAASVDPFNWLFVIGALVLAVVYAVPGGLLALPARLRRRPGKEVAR